jgi:hypothetical protein
MSNTYRIVGDKKLGDAQIKYVWRGKEKKLKPFSTNGAGKFKIDKLDKPTRQAKEVIKNANRSLKKGLRQQYKNEIKKELETMKKVKTQKRKR